MKVTGKFGEWEGQKEAGQPREWGGGTARRKESTKGVVSGKEGKIKYFLQQNPQSLTEIS